MGLGEALSCRAELGIETDGVAVLDDGLSVLAFVEVRVCSLEVPLLPEDRITGARSRDDREAKQGGNKSWWTHKSYAQFKQCLSHPGVYARRGAIEWGVRYRRYFGGITDTAGYPSRRARHYARYVSVATGDETSQAQIDAIIASLIGGAEELSPRQ
jgi:hypothetical protein